MDASKNDERSSVTGLEFLQRAIGSGGLGIGIGLTLGLMLDTVEDGSVSISGTPGPEHSNPLGTVHGGYVATLLDAAMGLAVQTRLDMGVRYATTNLNVTYVKGVPPNRGPVRSEGRVLNISRTLALAEARVTDDDDRLFAHATAIFAISDRKN